MPTPGSLREFIPGQQLQLLVSPPGTRHAILAAQQFSSAVASTDDGGRYEADGSSIHGQWQTIDDRHGFLTDSLCLSRSTDDAPDLTERLCLIGDVWGGKTTTIEQIACLRSRRGHLAFLCNFADLPDNAGEYLNPDAGVLWLVDRFRYGLRFQHQTQHVAPIDRLRDLENASVVKCIRTHLRRHRLTLLIDVAGPFNGQVSKWDAIAGALADFLWQYPEVRCIVAAHPDTVVNRLWDRLFAGNEAAWNFARIDAFTPQQIHNVIDQREVPAINEATAGMLRIPGVLAQVVTTANTQPETDSKDAFESRFRDAVRGWRNAALRVKESASRPTSRPVSRAAFRFAALNQVTTGANPVGREYWYDWLNNCLAARSTRIVILHAFGGFGKTTVVKAWRDRLDAYAYPGIDQGFGYSFYEQGKDSGGADSGLFLSEAIETFRGDSFSQGDNYTKVNLLIDHIVTRRTLLIVDGTEVIQHPRQGDSATQFRDGPFESFLFKLLDYEFDGLCVLTTRYLPQAFRDVRGVECRELPPLDPASARQVLTNLGVRTETVDSQGNPAVDRLIDDFDGHPLALTLAGRFLAKHFDGDPRRYDQIPDVPETASLNEDYEHKHTSRVLNAYAKALQSSGSTAELYLMHLLALFNRPIERKRLLNLVQQRPLTEIADGDVATPACFDRKLAALQETGLLDVETVNDVTADSVDKSIDTHPLIRSFFRNRFVTRFPAAWRHANSILFRSVLAECPPRLTAITGAHVSVSGQRGEITHTVDDDLWKSKQREAVRRLQLKAANRIIDAIAHGCEAGQHWDALATMMVRLDEQLRPVPEWLLRTGFAAWSRFNQERWFIAAISLFGRVTLNGFFGLKGLLKHSGQIDKPAQFAVARVLQGWDLRLSCAAHFHQERNFSNPSRLEDPLSGSVFDLETMLCLIYVGRVAEAKVATYRVRDRLRGTGIRLFAYVSATGLALLELYTAYFDKAVAHADEALRVSQTPQQRADALAVRAFARDLQGHTTDAAEMFQDALGRVSRLSQRCVYLYWKSLIRHGDDVEATSRIFEQQANEGPKSDRLGSHLDWETVVRNVRLHLEWRRTIETGSLHPRQYLHRVETAFNGFPAALHVGFHHRTMMTFHRARALTVCALSPDSGDADIARAMAELDATDRHATTAGFRIVEADTLVLRYRLLDALGRMTEAAAVRNTAEQLLDTTGYAWGYEDLERPWKNCWS